MAFWWLSFADPRRPKGQQFLGVAIVEADSFAEAHTASVAWACNPGGEVRGHQLAGEPPEGMPVHQLIPDRADVERWAQFC